MYLPTDGHYIEWRGAKRVTLDYGGEPVFIENGQPYDVPSIDDKIWDSDNLEWVDVLNDEYAPLSKSQFDYWCNGWNGRAIP